MWLRIGDGVAVLFLSSPFSLAFAHLFFILSQAYGDQKPYYYHFVEHCGAFFGLKWRIWRAKMYFSPLKYTNEKDRKSVV